MQHTFPTDLPSFLTRWPSGDVVVTGTRVLFFSIVQLYKEGESVESLGVRYPHISLATLHKIVGYYLEQQAAIDPFVAEHQVELDRLRESGPVLDVISLKECFAAHRQVS